ncbi:nitroreductase family protein [Candidatus Bathyarchaeota archaeon]|nr:nitroreductase family protein [Candidatus Bathyarchaeota archaeon]
MKYGINMTASKIRGFGMKKTITVCLIACIIFYLVFHFYTSGPVSSVTLPYSLEETISRRLSTRNYISVDISSQQLLDVLWAAYGYANAHRSAPLIGYDHSLIIFPVNATGSYQYIPENNSLVTHDLSVNKETIRSHDQGWPSDASAVLVVVWNSTKMSNGFFASAEAGCFVQNVYLAAASLDLGTCCVGYIESAGLRSDLGLSDDLTPLLVMPLGYPADPYPPASPNYDMMTGNLPPVQYSNMSFKEATANVTFAHHWTAENLSQQELSQLLWATYGYTNVTHDSTYHRTTPSAYGIYPLVIFVSNATGVYQYLPETHSVVELLSGDKRWEMEKTCSVQTWAADAPALFLVAYNSSYNNGDTGDGGAVSHEFIEVDSGAAVQQLFLEASAFNLSANIVSNSLETWNGATAEELRNILNLPQSLIPLYLIPIGHKTTTPIHDVAAANITPSQTMVIAGTTLDINVTIQNLGDYVENCSLTLYANATVIGNQTVHNFLDGTTSTLTFTWNTIGFEMGNYTLAASIEPVPDETNTDNNSLDDIQIIIIPEFSTAVLVLLMLATFLIVIAYKNKLGCLRLSLR